MGKILLGCIADDFTGATDLANNLVRAGMRVVQTIGTPSGALDAEVDAVVVALKSRTIAPSEAVASVVGVNRDRSDECGKLIRLGAAARHDAIAVARDDERTPVLVNPGRRQLARNEQFLDGGDVAFRGWRDHDRVDHGGMIIHEECLVA